jgi:hypothetical protein
MSTMGWAGRVHGCLWRAAFGALPRAVLWIVCYGVAAGICISACSSGLFVSCARCNHLSRLRVPCRWDCALGLVEKTRDGGAER